MPPSSTPSMKDLADRNASQGDGGSIQEPKPEPDLINEYQFFVLSIILWYGVQIPITAFGVGTNVLNIVIFRMSGLNDSVSITLTALSLSDLGYVAVFFLVRVIGLLNRTAVLEKRTISYPGLIFYISYFALLFQDVSVIITVFVAVQKCSCVAIPHLFKNVFTPGKTVGILLALSLMVTLTYLPMLAGMTFSTLTVPLPNNDTFQRIHVWAHPLYFRGLSFWMMFNKIVFPSLCQGITLLCVVIILGHLRRSVKLRASGTTDQRESLKLGEKERRVISAVAAVSIIYVVSTLPATLLTAAQLIGTTFFNDPRNKTFRSLVDNCQNILIHISASINIFVYLKYNSKFRETAVGISCQRFGCFYRP